MALSKGHATECRYIAFFRPSVHANKEACNNISSHVQALLTIFQIAYYYLVWISQGWNNQYK